MNPVTQKNIVTNRSGMFQKGAGVMSAPGPANDPDVTDLPYKPRSVASDGGGASKGGHRLRGQREKHYNGGTSSIPTGSTAVPR